MNPEEMMKSIVEQLRASLATQNVIGEAIVLGDKTLIPFTSIGLGFGSGAGEGGDAKQKGKGGGGGGGGGVEPVAAVVVFRGIEGPEGVKVLPLQKASPMAKAIGETLGGLAKAMSKQKKEKTASSPRDASADREGNLLQEIQDIRSQLGQLETQLEEAARPETSEV